MQDTFFNSVIPVRIDHLIGFATTTFAIHPRGERIVPITVRVGGRTYRYIFGNAAAAVGPSATIYLRNMISGRRFPSPQGVFVDRRLTARERRFLTVRKDLARDADVLVAARDHPACAAGVSRAAARGIARGRSDLVGGRGPGAGERRRDRAAPRRPRRRALGRAALPRRHRLPAGRGRRAMVGSAKPRPATRPSPR